jgi:TetR/AcrR family transcriptional repressor of bet genes
MHSNLMSGLAAMMPRREATTAALGISALIDGLWLRCGLQTGGIDRAHALEQMRLYLANIVDRRS